MQRAASQPLLQRSGPGFNSSPLCQALENELHLMATEATRIAAKASALPAARHQVTGVQELWVGACNNLKDLNSAFGSANQQVLELRAQLDHAEAQNGGLQGVLDAANARIANMLRQERNLIESMQASRHQKLQLVEQAHRQRQQQTQPSRRLWTWQHSWQVPQSSWRRHRRQPWKLSCRPRQHGRRSPV